MRSNSKFLMHTQICDKIVQSYIKITFHISVYQGWGHYWEIHSLLIIPITERRAPLLLSLPMTVNALISITAHNNWQLCIHYLWHNSLMNFSLIQSYYELPLWLWVLSPLHYPSSLLIHRNYHSYYSPIANDPNFIHYHFISHYWKDKASITQFLAAFCPHFYDPFITAASKKLLDFQWKYRYQGIPLFANENVCFDRQIWKMWPVYISRSPVCNTWR